MKIQFWSVYNEPATLVGEALLRNGKIITRKANDFVRWILSHPVGLHGKMVAPDQGETFLEAVTAAYAGSAFRAEIVEDEDNGAVKEPTPEDERDQDEGLRVGMDVEAEHAATYDKLSAYVEEYGELPPREVMFALIAKDHLTESPAYYSKLEAAGL